MPSEIPSFEDQWSSTGRPFSSKATRRLLCYIQGPSFGDQVFVLDDSSDPAGPRRLYTHNHPNGNTPWHSISHESLTTPTVSSVAVIPRELEEHPIGGRPKRIDMHIRITTFAFMETTKTMCPETCCSAAVKIVPRSMFLYSPRPQPNLLLPFAIISQPSTPGSSACERIYWQPH